VDGCIIDEVLLTIVIKYMQQDAKIQKCCSSLYSLLHVKENNPQLENTLA
jgi:hypothetical protein